MTGERGLIVLATLAFVALLVSVRDILIPPVVFPLVVLALWPLRNEPGIRNGLLAAGLLTLVWLLHGYGSLLGPFLLALAVAYLLAPLVDRLERRRVPRGVAILLVTLPPLAALAGIVAFTGPQVWDQAVALVNALPRFSTVLFDWLALARARLESLAFLTSEQRTWLHDLDAAQVGALLQQNADQILHQLAEWGWAFMRRLGTVVGFLGYLVVTPVVAFYLLRDWRRLLAFLENLLPPARRAGLIGFLQEYDHALGRFVRGQLLEATLVGSLTGIGLALLGVPNAMLLGVVAGLCNLVPYIGIAISLVPAMIVALTMPAPLGGLGRVALVFGLVQFIDGSVTGPRIVGGSVGLHPVVIMLALTFGGAVLGFVGLLLAIPLAVLVKLMGARAIARYRASEYFGGVTGPAA